jgi:hypothetical protein
MVNAFSFCLYGPENPKYYRGLLENIFLAGKYFPTWKVYVYYGPDVEEAMIHHLEACTSVVLRPTGVTGPINMIHRFYAIDEPEVDLMMVRDADSRIHWKDRWAIREFVNRPQFVAHTIRDNIQHTAEMMGGMWGIRKSSGLNMHAEYAAYTEDTEKGHRNGHDQNFLTDVIYPKVVGRMLVHYSNGRRKIGETAVEFPFDWINDTYCGRIELEYLDHEQPPEKPRLLQTPYASLRLDIPRSSPLPLPPPTPEPPIVSVKDTYVPPIVKFLHRK